MAGLRVLNHNEIIMIGDARDFHAMDWYRTVKKICGCKRVIYATDLIDSESRQKIVGKEDDVIELYNIDRFLLKKQFSVGDLWRNFVKVVVSPLQVLKIKSIAAKYPNAIFHAHTMYYMFLCWLSKIEFIGTPQGDEVLVRPSRSLVYKYFACKSLNAATHVIVDSVNLKNKIKGLCGKDAAVVQNGIDVPAINVAVGGSAERSGVLSFRAMYPLYRIDEILAARAISELRPSLSFNYPFWEDGYKRTILSKLDAGDLDLGRLPSKKEMYKVLSSTLLAISIPRSDSSPRSVYEAIFCGCCVAVTFNQWIENLPPCMRSRLFIVNLEDSAWFDKAIVFARSIVKIPFTPSETALNIFDQEKSMKRVVDSFYS